MYKKQNTERLPVGGSALKAHDYLCGLSAHTAKCENSGGGGEFPLQYTLQPTLIESQLDD